MKKVLGYVRVSDPKQESGVSKQEQIRSAKAYALKNSLQIVRWFNETKTAAKTGRPEFNAMLKELKENKEISGIVIHKIDRSARNFHDWASIGDLIDEGIDVHFAHESLDLKERGGRLSADIQAVMAADYIRNLKQETIKGLYGRLEQGIYPWAAPVGYLNHGRGELKTIDPNQGTIVKEMFRLYATGNYSLKTLTPKMKALGLRNHFGNPLSKNSINLLLRNPFFIGLMKAKDKTFDGKHEALVDVNTFQKVQRVLDGRSNNKQFKHQYLFRRKLKCANCPYTLSGELQKGHVYYRCQTKDCPTKCMREDVIELYVENVLRTMTLNSNEIQSLKEHLKSDLGLVQIENEKQKKKLRLDIAGLEKRKDKLIEAYLDEMLSKEECEKRKKDILLSLTEKKEHLNALLTKENNVYDQLTEFLELCKSPVKIYRNADFQEKQELIDIFISNLVIDQRKAEITIASPFAMLSDRDNLNKCCQTRDSNRIVNSKQVYCNPKTSPIVPKPLRKEHVKDFLKTLMENINTLPKLFKPNNNYEL